MSLLYEIGLLHDIYNQTGRAYIASEAYRNNRLKQYVTISVYLVVSVSVTMLNFFEQFHTIFLLTVVSFIAFCCYILVEEQISVKFKTIYNSFNLEKYPYFKRSLYLHYIFFSEEIDFKKIETEKFDLVTRWEEIRKETISTATFATSPLYIVLVSSLFALITEYLKSDNSITGKYVVLACVVVVVITYFWWLFIDILNSESKRNLALCKFLKWHLLEKI